MSTIYYVNEYEKEFVMDIETVKLAEILLDKSLDILKCEYEAECSLIITSPEEIRCINCDNRGIDRETDVLSFPLIDFDEPCGYSCIDENDFTQFNPDTGELMLGDIIISYERAVEQAQEYGHSIKREVAFLIVHSILHLFGYDHMDDDERIVMEDKQREILDALNITR